MEPFPSRKARKYHITQCDLEILEAQQGGFCAICGEPFGPEGYAIDHDHSPEARGRVRGLLHGTCNSVLAMAHDRPEVLLRAFEYLTGVPALPVATGTT
jgi:Recombination endonuclease VII